VNAASAARVRPIRAPVSLIFNASGVESTKIAAPRALRRKRPASRAGA